MVKFLINRPIAVNMVYLALFLLGIVSFRYFPVSLLPTTDIPEISIRVNAPGMSARMVQNTVNSLLLSQVKQVKHLEELHSEAQNNQAFIRLRFRAGTHINLAFIELSEKIDAIMPYLPREIERPQIIKARLTDIPVFYLALSYKNERNMLQFSEFVRSVVKPRIEQLPTVAMADMSGLQQAEIAIIPDALKMQVLNISLDDIQLVLQQNNIELSNILLRQRQYEYFVKIDNRLRSIEDIENLIFKRENRFFRLVDIAKIVKRPAKEQGRFYFGKNRAINLAIIKNSDAQMAELRLQMEQLFAQFQAAYPEVNFELFRNQTKLLDFSIKNLQQSLFLGVLFSVLISWIFLRHWKYALLIAANVVLSLVISFLLIWLLGVSINIISLSGLILAVGMMIDNAIIVVENIHQQPNGGDKAIVLGTNQVIVPLLSSMFTTLAVFLPLIFIGGITQVLFFDQALTIAVGMLSALVVSVTFLPVWIHYWKLANDGIEKREKNQFWQNIYKQTHFYFFQHKKFSLSIMLALILFAVFFIWKIPKRLLPQMSQKDVVLLVNWNENISLDENYKRYSEIVDLVSNSLVTSSLLAGIPQFSLGQKRIIAFYDSEIYLDFISYNDLLAAKYKLNEIIRNNYPNANLSYSPADNIFNRVFEDNRAALQLNLYSSNISKEIDLKLLDSLMLEINMELGTQLESPLETQYIIELKHQNMARFDVRPPIVVQKLKTIFSGNQIGELRSFQQQIPICLAQNEANIYDLLKNAYVLNKNAQAIPLIALLDIKKGSERKNIISGISGEYIPLEFDIDKRFLVRYQEKIEQILEKFSSLQFSFSGTLLDGGKVMQTTGFLFLLSIILLYVILAATFNSVKLPLIILVEIPIDLAGVFLALYLWGSSLNMMSAIGIIVMSGIVINDSILKIDTINRLVESGKSLSEAIEQGSEMRVKAILMTSLTTILALVPLLFVSGMGVEMQLPLVLAVIGGLGLGTLVSLFGIPVLYYYLKR